jgi:ribosome-associated protein
LGESNIKFFYKDTKKISIQKHLSAGQKNYFSLLKFPAYLEPLSILDSRKKSSAARLTKNSQLFIVIIDAIQQKKAENIISLDLRKIPESAANFFIVCEATSNVQIKAITDSVEKEVYEKCGEKPYRHEGFQALKWIIIDYINVVVHIMQPETRRFYNLEEMWSDAPQDIFES